MKTTTVDPLPVLRVFVARWARHRAKQKLAAQALGLSPAYLSDLLHGRRQFSDSVLTKLGLQRVVVRVTR